MKFTVYYLGFGQPTTEDSLPLPDQSNKLKARLSEVSLWSRNQRCDI